MISEIDNDNNDKDSIYSKKATMMKITMTILIKSKQRSQS